MFSVIILSIIIVISASYLAYVIIKKFPDLKNLDITSMPNAKQGAIKVKILEAKLQRSGDNFKKKFNKLVTPKFKSMSSSFLKLKEKVSAMEAHYKLKGEVNKEKPAQSVEEIVEEGRQLMGKEEFVAAEKKLIEAISTDKKNVKAYEALGELYFDNKCFDQAEEIYKYLIRLYILATVPAKKRGHFKNGKLQEIETELLNSLEIDPKVAAYYCDLAKVYEMLDNKEKALDSYMKANAIEPNNPKYLDKIIDLAVKLKDKDLAKQMFYHLKKINPENGKLEELQFTIEKI